jgi:hypothetical protein
MSTERADDPVAQLGDDVEDMVADRLGVDREEIRVRASSKPLPRSEDSFETLTVEWVGDHEGER